MTTPVFVDVPTPAPIAKVSGLIDVDDSFLSKCLVARVSVAPANPEVATANEVPAVPATVPIAKSVAQVSDTPTFSWFHETSNKSPSDTNPAGNVA